MEHLGRILIVPAGTDNGYEVWESLKGRYEVFCADVLEDNPTSVASCSFVKVPYGLGSDFWSELSKACIGLGIDLVIPTHDDLLVPMAEMIRIGGARTLTSPVEACRVTLRKDTTYSFLRANGLSDMCPACPGALPGFLRPNHGRGSRNAFKVESREALDLLEQLVPDNIVTEFLPGKEYTIDCLSDLEGKLLGHCTRERIYISNGITKIGVTVENIAISNMAKRIADCLKTAGPWFFQVKENSLGVPMLTEINLRVGGTSGLSRIAGFNHILMATRLFLGEPVGVVAPPQMGVMVSRGPLLHTRLNMGCVKLVLWDLDDTVWTGELSENNLAPAVISEVAATIAILSTKKVKMGIVTSNKLLALGGSSAVLSCLSEAGVYFPFDPILFSSSGKLGCVEDAMRNGGLLPSEVVLVDDSFRERADVASGINGLRTLDPGLHYLLRSLS
jgi:hypothetical protein